MPQRTMAQMQAAPEGDAAQAPAPRQQATPPAPAGDQGGVLVPTDAVPLPAASSPGAGLGAILLLLAFAAILVVGWRIAKRRRRRF